MRKLALVVLSSGIKEQKNGVEPSTEARPENKIFLPTTWWLLIVSLCVFLQASKKKVLSRQQNYLVHRDTAYNADHRAVVIGLKEYSIGTFAFKPTTSTKVH